MRGHDAGAAIRVLHVGQAPAGTHSAGGYAQCLGAANALLLP
jgi:hypothetical protein